MPSSTIKTTLQAALLSAISNVMAQVITAYQDEKPLFLNWKPLVQFVAWALISTPPNVYWQDFLEASFPSTVQNGGGQRRLSKRNTVSKFVLDQTVGAAANTAGFIAGLNAMKGRNTAEISSMVQQDFWPLVQSGWKLWPLVSLLNFTVVPANRRILFGSVVGLFWGIYLSLIAAH